jgi:hypothetical protein
MISNGRMTTSKGFHRANARSSGGSGNKMIIYNDKTGATGADGRDMLMLRGDLLKQINEKGVRKGVITLADMTDSTRLQSYFVDLRNKVAARPELAQQFVGCMRQLAPARGSC